ncbi:MAG: methionine--tRNA ligase [bacterium]|nr:methionine--tRNA ligase [bacterium]
MGTGRFYITAAIDYPNALPHIGTAYEKIGADVIARYKALCGLDSFFVMGTDEHSANVEKAAEEQGVSPQEFTDSVAPKFLEAWRTLGIGYTSFVRSSSERHARSVQDIFQKIYEKGDIYEGFYEGWYCNSCERFFQQKDLDGELCPTHRRPVEWVKERNYIFALSRYSGRILKHIRENPGFIEPESRRNEMLSLIEGGLEDISVSRVAKKWGIPLPFDSSQTIYVWFDALICYLTGIGYSDDSEMFARYWPADVHVIGKDITRFHCAIWPAMLMAAGIPLPKKIWAHGFVHLDGQKLSKTAGVMVDPVEAANKYGADALRYFLMREIPFDRDGDFSWAKFEERYAADLANDLGNLVNRVIAMIGRYCGGKVPQPSTLQPIDAEIAELAEQTVKNAGSAIDEFRLSSALVEIWAFVSRCNRYVEETAPWKVRKEGTKERLDTILYVLAEAVRIIGGLILPFMPRTADRICQQLGLERDSGHLRRDALENWGRVAPGTRVREPQPLFPKMA